MSDRVGPRGDRLPGLSKPLSEMSDRELEEEIQRRRRLRAAARKPEAPITEADRRALERFEREISDGSDRTGMAAAVERAELAKHYAALELRPGASLSEVQAKYRELMAKYHPDKHVKDPDKHAAAIRLVQELTRAYQILSERLAK